MLRLQNQLDQLTYGTESPWFAGDPMCGLPNLSRRIRDCHAKSHAGDQLQIRQVIADVTDLFGR